jgi:type I restriction enzyme M protein
LARDLVQQDRTLTRAHIPPEYCWKEIRRSPVDLGERLTTALKAIACENPKLKDVIDRRDFNITEVRIFPSTMLIRNLIPSVLVPEYQNLP